MVPEACAPLAARVSSQLHSLCLSPGMCGSCPARGVGPQPRRGLRCPLLSEPQRTARVGTNHWLSVVFQVVVVEFSPPSPPRSKRWKWRFEPPSESTRFHGNLILSKEGVRNAPRSRPPYPAEFRRQMVELVQSGRAPGELSREVGVTYRGGTGVGHAAPHGHSSPPTTRAAPYRESAGAAAAASC